MGQIIRTERLQEVLILQLIIRDMMNTQFCYLMRVFLLGLLVILGMVTHAYASVMVSPIYVIFDGRKRSAEVTLLNSSNEENVYRLSWTYNRQKEDGSYDVVEKLKEGDPDPASFIRFSPRQVVIPPQGRQSVRLQLQKPADLPDGEYRIHLTFKQLPKDKGPEKEVGGPGVTAGLRVTLGISIPIVVRQGEYKVSAKIDEARFIPVNDQSNPDPYPKLKVKVLREGVHGTYGRLRVLWNDGDRETQIGELNNFAIYAETLARIGYVPLNVEQVPSGKLRIIYEGDGPQRGVLFSEQIINVGK